MKTSLRRRAAFTLIEVALALGVAGFCLIPLFGLLPVGISSNQTSVSQTAAGSIAGAVISDLRSPLVSGTTPRFGFTFSTTQPQTVYFGMDGTTAGAPGSQPSTGATGTSPSTYRATIGVIASTATNSRCATEVRLLITWPALADPKPAQWPTNYSGSYETVVGFNRN